MIQQLVVLFLLSWISTESLNSAPVLSPAKFKNKDSFKYSTKIKKSKYFHHHYIYHNSKTYKKSTKHDHDHVIKIPTEERISRLYDIIDINKDGIITENELKSLLHVHKYPEHHPRHDQLIETAKLRMDINSDGIIEKYEYMNHMKQATKDLSDQLLFAQIPRQHLLNLANLHQDE